MSARANACVDYDEGISGGRWLGAARCWEIPGCFLAARCARTEDAAAGLPARHS